MDFTRSQTKKEDLTPTGRGNVKRFEIMDFTPKGQGNVKRFEQWFEMGRPKDYVAIYFVLEAPFSLGRGWLYLSLNDTLTRAIPLANGSAEHS